MKRRFGGGGEGRWRLRCVVTGLSFKGLATKGRNIVRIVWSLGFIVCLFTVALPAFGEGVNGTITGTVTDPSGSVVAGVPVEAKNVETGALYSAASTSTGNYAIPNVPVGSYTVTATVSGFKTYTHTNLAIIAGQVLREDISLQVGTAAESVTVSAEAALLSPERGETALIGQVREMDEFPYDVISVGSQEPLATPSTLTG